jgi:hypothetical protein
VAATHGPLGLADAGELRLGTSWSGEVETGDAESPDSADATP